MYETVALGIVVSLQLWTLKKQYDVNGSLHKLENEVDIINEFGCDKSRREREKQEDIQNAEKRKYHFN